MVLSPNFINANLHKKNSLGLKISTNDIVIVMLLEIVFLINHNFGYFDVDNYSLSYKCLIINILFFSKIICFRKGNSN